MGRYTNAIGPPKSMQDLANLLSCDFDVERGFNLKNRSYEGSKQNPQSASRRPLLQKIKMGMKNVSFFYNVVSFLYLLKFNFEVFHFAFKNPTSKIIITQSSLIYIPFFPNIERVIYIRRGNSIIKKLSRSDRSDSTSFVKKYANNSFVKYKGVKKIYLVDNGKLPYKYTVIPNYFDVNSFDLNYPDDRDISLSYIGTWCDRKGASLYLDLVELAKAHDCLKANVYGVLGGDKVLNDRLLNNFNVNYLGLVPKPSSYMRVGDIFVSFSSLEGLQRSLVESMLSGCIVIGLERPDTLSLADCPGVFIFKKDNELMKNVFSVLECLLDMTMKERQCLGENCREYASNVFSKESVLSSWKKILNA